LELVRGTNHKGTKDTKEEFYHRDAEYTERFYVGACGKKYIPAQLGARNYNTLN
jgi:hypothetical protein